MASPLGRGIRFGYRTDVTESTRLPRVVVYSRGGCCLCDDLLAEVDRARQQVDFSLEIVDVDERPELIERYGDEVPVVEIDGRKAFKYRLTGKQLMRRLTRKRWF
jgi:hypothetical protein